MQVYKTHTHKHTHTCVWAGCLQVLYGMLIQHFAMLAGEVPLPLSHLDAMVPLLLPMTSEVPFYAATVARAR